MHASSLAGLVVFYNIIKVYRCQINRQAFHKVIENKYCMCDKSGCLRSPEILIFCHNNVILFYRVNYNLQGMFS